MGYDIEIGTQNYDSDWAGKIVCWFPEDDASAEKICKTLGKSAAGEGFIVLEQLFPVSFFLFRFCN